MKAQQQYQSNLVWITKVAAKDKLLTLAVDRILPIQLVTLNESEDLPVNIGMLFILVAAMLLLAP